MYDCEYTNENYDEDYSGGCNCSSGNASSNEFNASNSYNGCGNLNESNSSNGLNGFSGLNGSNGSNGLNGLNGSNGSNGANSSNMGNSRRGGQQQAPQGQVRRYNNNYSVNGANYQVANKNYYNNNYSRYNNYYVKEYNYVKSFVRDYNIYHYSTQTINEGCEYLGATNVIANNGCGNSSSGCSCGN